MVKICFNAFSLFLSFPKSSPLYPIEDPLGISYWIRNGKYCKEDWRLAMGD